MSAKHTPCGCEIRLGIESMSLVRCATHEAASDLLSALEVVFECERTGKVWPDGHFGKVSQLLKSLGLKGAE